jgi:carbon-monoxide dehydrogenase medium subunit
MQALNATIGTNMDYITPNTLQDALELMDQDGYRALATGLSQSRFGGALDGSLRALVSLRKVPGLNGVTQSPSEVRVGPSVRYVDLMEHPAIRAIPLLNEALSEIGEPHVRNHGSLGGALQSGGLADAPVLAALMALDAEVILAGRTGPVQQSVQSFSRGGLRVGLPAGRLAVEVVIPVGQWTSCRYLPLERTQGLGPVSGIALALCEANALVGDVRLVVAGFTEQPVRLTTVEAALTGKPLTADSIRQASAAIVSDIESANGATVPNAYSLHLISVLIRRVLLASQSATATS